MQKDEEHIFDYDQILVRVNEFGSWQKYLFLLLWIPSAASAMAVFMYEFIAFTPDHRCTVSACESTSASSVFRPDFVNFSIPFDDEEEDYAQCEMFRYAKSGNVTCESSSFDNFDTIDCPDGWTFDTDTFSSTATIDLQMICGSDWKKSLAQSIYMVGMLVGSFIFGFLSDHFGRRTALLISAIVLAGGGTISAILPANPSVFPAFATCRFVSGMGHVGMFMMSFGLAVEYTGPKWRVFCGCLIETPFAIGGLIVGFLAWGGVRNWRTLQLICSAPWILILGYKWLVPESPRWLLSKGHLKQLEQDTRKAAKINKREFPTDLFSSEHSVSQETAEIMDKVSIWDLFKPRQICFRTLSMFYNWVVTTLCYYGLTMTASTLSSNVFLNYTLLILVEIPAHFVCIYIMDSWGRKPILGLCQIVSGLACVVAGFLDDIKWLQVALSLVGKFGATACFTIVFVYTAELFPTVIRSTAVGSSSLCGRIGGFLAPQVAYLAAYWAPLPLIIMGSSALIGGIVALLALPETLGEKLPETMEEAIHLGSKKKEKQLQESKFSSLYS